MSTTAAESYNETPYKSRPFPATHPDRLATIATLHGLASAPPDRCRVLEIGCAGGANLLAMADQLPESEFVGIDLSPVQIAEGRRAIETLGLKNLSLICGDLLDVDRGFGEFDYIVAHGVYSWVPPAAREKILDICATNLRPNGVAYVSYNTLPGWRLQSVARDLMSYRARKFRDPADRVREARGVLELMAQASQKNTVYGALLREAIANLDEKADYYLLHEYLEEENTAFYFHEFVRDAGQKALRYLAEADLRLAEDGLPPEMVPAVRAVASDEIEVAQYADFASRCMFRVTLLCHAGAHLTRSPDPRRVTGLHVASPALTEEPTRDVQSTEPLTFVQRQCTATTADPLFKAVLIALGERWPESVPFAALLTEARSRAGLTGDESADAAQLAEMLFALYFAGQVDLTVLPSRASATLGHCPEVPRLARFQAVAGGEATSLRHEPVAIDDLQRFLLQFLDGRHDRDALLDRLLGIVRSGELDLRKEGRPVSDAEASPILTAMLDRALADLAREALFRPTVGQPQRSRAPGDPAQTLPAPL